MTETITAESVLAQIENLKDEVFAFTSMVLGDYDNTCGVCGEPAPSTYYDCIGHIGQFAGGFSPLCDRCYDLNELLWDMARIRRAIRDELDALVLIALIAAAVAG